VGQLVYFEEHETADFSDFKGETDPEMVAADDWLR
jgi:hypothetical protein